MKEAEKDADTERSSLTVVWKQNWYCYINYFLVTVFDELRADVEIKKIGKCW